MFFLVLHVRQEVTDEPTAFLVLLNNPYTPKYNLNVSDLKIFFFFPAIQALSFVVAQGISVGFFNVQLTQISAGYMSFSTAASQGIRG